MAKSILDHLTQANENLRSLAAANKLTLPAVTDEGALSVVHDLDTKTGHNFDREYLHAVISDCADTVQTLRAETGLPDPGLSAFSRNEVPLFQQRLATAQRLIERVNGP